MSVLNEYGFLSANGRTEIYVREFIPDGEPRAIVQLAHGIGEHVARYDGFSRYLCERGFLVTGNDHLGHGRTARPSGDFGFFSEFRGWDMAVHDMRRLTDLTCAKYPGIPVFLLGHSMGSFLARTYIIRYRTGLGGVIFSGTGQQPLSLLSAGIRLAESEEARHGPRYHSRRVWKFTSSLKRGTVNSARPADWLSRDTAVVDDFVADELTGHRATVSLLRDMLGGMRYNSLSENLEKMNKELPVLFFSGEHDLVGESGRGVMKAYRLFVGAGMRDVTLKLYAEGRHAMLSETNRAEVYSDVLNWIEHKLAG